MQMSKFASVYLPHSRQPVSISKILHLLAYTCARVAIAKQFSDSIVSTIVLDSLSIVVYEQ
jgi:hypothetical protein